MRPPNNRKGSGFTNINRVVTANQGNKLGQTVSSGVQNQANQVKDSTQNATTRFNDEAQKNRLDTTEAANKRDETIGRFSDVNQKEEVNANDDDVNNFAKYRTGTYEGPNQLQDYQSLAGKASNTEQLGDLSRSSGGRQELLKRFVGGSGYTQGQQVLDNVLLGQSGNALNQARRSTQGLTQNVAGANTQAASLAQEYANRAKIFGQETSGKLQAARDPISGKIDEQMKLNLGKEESLNKDFQSLQGILSGSDQNYSKLDRITRLGLGLQAAKDSGFLNDVQVNQLLGDGGLIQRAEQLGLDTNALVNERLSQIKGENLGRGGAANKVQESQINSLDRLMGKQGSDLEFSRGIDDYKNGSNNFNLDSLNDYLSKAENSKYENGIDDNTKAGQQRYLDQAKGGVGQSMGGVMQTAGAGLNQFLDPQSYYDPRQMGQNINQAVQGGTSYLAGAGTAMTQTPNAVLEGIAKLNIGGNSIANTEGGKQLLKAIELASKTENKAIGGLQGVGNGIGEGIQDLSKGNIGGALDQYLKVFTGDNLFKGAGYGGTSNVIGNVGNAVSNAVSKITGGGIKISDEDLKTNIDYDRKHIDDFLSKLKPAAYDYKDEVKDSPLASDKRQIGVMAQDLEKSKLGKESVIDTEAGKAVDYDELQPKMLAALATLKADIDELKKKK